jgi:glucokinase
MTMLTEPGTTSAWSKAVVAPVVVAGSIVLGIDIGGTKTAAMVVDAADRVLGRAEQPTDRGAPVRVAVEVARAAMTAADLPMGSLKAVGVAVPGDVDVRTGTVRLAVNLDALDLPLGELLAQVLEVPCFVEHDARAAAIWLAARPEAAGDLAYLSIGTGIAAGVVIDGQPLTGDNGLAGEIGHCVADPDGPICACGLRGCLEAIAAGPAVALAAQVAVDGGEPSLLRDRAPGVPITAEAVYAAAERGDPLALRVTAEAAAAIGRAVRSLVLSYGVAKVVIGGGPSRAGESFTRPLLRSLEDERSASALVRRAFLGTVEVLPPDAQPTSWGAITVARIGLHRKHAIDSERRQARADER